MTNYRNSLLRVLTRPLWFARVFGFFQSGDAINSELQYLPVGGARASSTQLPGHPAPSSRPGYPKTMGRSDPPLVSDSASLGSRLCMVSLGGVYGFGCRRSGFPFPEHRDI